MAGSSPAMTTYGIAGFRRNDDNVEWPKSLASLVKQFDSYQRHCSKKSQRNYCYDDEHDNAALNRRGQAAEVHARRLTASGSPRDRLTGAREVGSRWEMDRRG
jgi:hypothetical protein